MSEFWWGLQCTYRLPLVKWSFSHYSYLSISIDHLSIFWYFHCFISSGTQSSCYANLSLIWLVLLLRILYYDGYCFCNSFLGPLVVDIKEGQWFFFSVCLYPVTLLKMFISFMSSLVEYLVFLMYTIMSPANRDTLTSSFPIYVPLISFCCLIALVRTSSIILDRERMRSLVFSLILMGIF